MKTNEKIKDFMKRSGVKNVSLPDGLAQTSSQEKEHGTTDNTSPRILKIFDFFLMFSLLAIFFGLPLFFTNLSFQGTSFEKQIYFYFWTLLALIAWASKSGYLGEVKIKKTPLDIPILFFWFSYLISTVFSIDKWHSFFGFFGDPSRGFLNITALLVVYYLILSNFNLRLFKLLFKGVLLSGSIVVLFSAFGILGMNFFPGSWSKFFPITFFGSIESLSIFLSLFVPVLVSSILKNTRSDNSSKSEKFFSGMQVVILIIDLSLLFILYPYVQWMGLLIGMVMFLIFILSKMVRSKGFWTVLPMFVFILILFFLMIGQTNLFQTQAKLPLSVNVPYKISWSISRESLNDKFFFGYGAADYSYAFSKNMPRNFDNMGIRFTESQGIIFESLATIGTVGAAFLIILILTFLGSSLFLLSRDKEKNKLYSLGLVSSSVVALVDVLMSRAEASVLIFWILLSSLAVGTLYLESKTREDFFKLSLKTSPKFALTLAFVYILILASVIFAFVFIGKVYVADIEIGRAVKMNDITKNGSIAAIERAVNINPKEGRYFILLGKEYMALVNQEILKDGKERDINQVQSYLSLAIQAGEKSEKLMENDVSVVENLAQIYENAGLYVKDAFQLAQEKYERAGELEPSNPVFPIKLGQIKIGTVDSAKKDEDEEKEKIKEARDLFQKAVDMRNNYAAAYYNLALADESLGDLDQSIENISQALILEKNNLNYSFSLARIYQKRGKDDDFKRAESIYRQILSVNDKDINTHFSLALLYEKTGKNDLAVSELKRVSELFPSGTEKAKEKIQKMINNIQNGIPNTAENLGLTSDSGNQDSESNQNDKTVDAP